MSLSDLHPLFAALPEPLADVYEPEAPWSTLGAPFEALLAALPGDDVRIPLAPDFHLLGDRIVIGEGTRILPGAVLEGPVRIGRDCEIRPGAYLRGGVWLGDGCVVGANTEVKRSLLLDGAKAPHLSYVGDSIVGAGVNLGAGTILSNLRFDHGEIHVPVDGERRPTGRRKLGALLGDRSQTGSRCVLDPGVILAPDSLVFPGVHVRPGVYRGQVS